ncbi:hypothetical protein AAHA92_29241 [Salvia divinorum]|uniref:Uncharacterized protein n=1 Tax=Salvia divinorum TaxID=28513 RepID=A0ABD1FXQ3_SALDI
MVYFSFSHFHGTCIDYGAAAPSPLFPSYFPLDSSHSLLRSSPYTSSISSSSSHRRRGSSLPTDAASWSEQPLASVASSRETDRS